MDDEIKNKDDLLHVVARSVMEFNDESFMLIYNDPKRVIVGTAYQMANVEARAEYLKGEQ